MAAAVNLNVNWISRDVRLFGGGGVRVHALAVVSVKLRIAQGYPSSHRGVTGALGDLDVMIRSTSLGRCEADADAGAAFA